MKRLGIVATLILAGLSTGCRNQAAQELLERELRRQEDRIFQLQDKVDSLECENRALYQQSAFATESSLPAGTTIRRAPGNDRTNRTRDIVPSPEEPTVPVVEPPPAFRRPEISPPTPDRPEGEIRPSNAPPPAFKPASDASPSIGGNGNELKLPPLTVPALNDTSLNEPADVAPGTIRNISERATGDQAVAAITLNPDRTGGYNADGQYGDEGIMVVIEPRNANGDIIDVPGKISVVVIDPMLSGDAARLARWDIPFDDAKARIHGAPMGTGLPLQLRWKGNAPQHRSLDVFVRYTTPDGRRFDADKAIDVEPLAMLTPPVSPSSEWVGSGAPAGTPTLAPRRGTPGAPRAVAGSNNRAPAPTAARPRTPTPTTPGSADARSAAPTEAPRGATRSSGWTPYR